MKLSELIPHTSTWTGVPDTHVNTVARVLRPAGLISSQGRGPGGAVMTTSDKINLLLGTCGVEIANRAADYVKLWRKSFRYRPEPDPDFNFAFLQAENVEDLLVNLITKDLNGGALSAWLKEADAALAKKLKRQSATNHAIAVDFCVDGFSLDLKVSRNVLSIETSLERTTSDTISVRFAAPPPPYHPLPPRMSDIYIESSQLIRRLNERNLIGWGACLAD
jgi:hypothetical protein